LNDHGAAVPELATDSIFGPLTEKVTRAYQRSHGLAIDAIIGPRTWASLDGPTVLGGATGQGKGGGPTPGNVIRYDSTRYTISPPAPGTKLTDIYQALQNKQDAKPPQLGKTLKAEGVAVGTDEEIFLWNILVQLGEKSRWGTEADLLTAIGRATKATKGQTPMGKVTLVIDPKGNATVTLVARGTVIIPPAIANRAAAEAALASFIGTGTVKDGSAAWTLEELAKVLAAFQRLPSADRVALAGVDLIREHTLNDAKGNPLAGLFSHEASVKAGATSATRSDTLSIADGAFSGDALSFIGDAKSQSPASFQTILHEVGHAVETKGLREAQFASLQAQANLNGKIIAMNTAIQAANSATKAAFNTFNTYSNDQRKSATTYVNSVNAVTGKLNAMSSNNDVAKHQPLEKAATQTLQARDAAKAALSKSNAGHPALTDFVSASSRQDDWFAAAKERATAHIQLNTAKVAETAVSGAPGQSKRLKNFVDFVNKSKVEPVTEYAAKNWPAHPEEFFAEAYSLWLNDRVYLETNAKPLVGWFDAGEHLK
jgi:hypothetical protein